jgi:hypothetical protein
MITYQAAMSLDLPPQHTAAKALCFDLGGTQRSKRLPRVDVLAKYVASQR